MNEVGSGGIGAISVGLAPWLWLVLLLVLALLGVGIVKLVKLLRLMLG
jgi:hypothetical protein